MKLQWGFFLLFALLLSILGGCGSSSPKPTLIGKIPISFLEDEKGKSFPSILYIETIAPSSDGEKVALLLFPSKFNAQFLVVDRNGKQVANQSFKERFVDMVALSQLMPYCNRTAPLLSWSVENDKVLLSLNRIEGGKSTGTHEVYIFNPYSSDIIRLDGLTTIGIHQQWSTNEGLVLLKKVEKDSSNFLVSQASR